MKAIFVIVLSCLSGMAGWAQRDSVSRADSIGKPVKPDTAGLLKPVELKAAIVTARPPLIQRTIDKTVVNVESSITGAGASVLEFMKKIPGVQVDADGTIGLVGKGGATIYIDGKQSYLSEQDLAILLRSMNASEIQRIELMPNPSAKYDAAGTGGIINIVRKKAKRPGWNGGLHTNWGQSDYSSYGLGGDLGYRYGAFSGTCNINYARNMTLSGSQLRYIVSGADGRPENVQDVGTRDVNREEGTDIALNADWDVSSATTLSFSGTGNFNGFADWTSSGQTNWNGKYEKTGGQDFEDYNRGHSFGYDGTVRLSHKIDTSGREISGEFGYINYPGHPVQDIVNRYYDDSGMVVGDSVNRLERVRGLHIYVGRVDYSGVLSGGWRFDAGWRGSFLRNDNRQWNYDGGNRYTGGDRAVTEEDIQAGYVSFNRQYKRMGVQAGLRAERSITRGRSVGEGVAAGLVDRRYLLFFPSLALDYKIGKKDRIGLQVSRRVTRPTYRVLNPIKDPMSATMYFQGDPELKPYINTTVELSYAMGNDLTYTQGVISYLDFFRNFNFPDSDGIHIVRSPAAIHRGWGHYEELSWNFSVCSWWQVSLDLWAYQRWFHGLVRGVRPGIDPVFTVNGHLNNELTMGHGWTGELACRYVTARQFTSTHFGPYSNISMGVRKNMFDGKGSLSLNVNNLLQREGTSQWDRNGSLLSVGQQFSYTRAVNLSLNYRVGKAKVVRKKTVVKEVQPLM